MELKEIENLEVGMPIKINKNVKLSMRKFGACTLKQNLAGTIQEISRIVRERYRIYVKSSSTISYHISDLDYVSTEELISLTTAASKDSKPEIFDPTNLIF